MTRKGRYKKHRRFNVIKARIVADKEYKKSLARKKRRERKQKLIEQAFKKPIKKIIANAFKEKPCLFERISELVQEIDKQKEGTFTEIKVPVFCKTT